MGLLDIPSYDKVGGIIALVLAIFLNGLGIMIWGLIKGVEKNTIIQGLVILLITVVLGIIMPALAGIGGLLALIWGIMVLIKSL